MSSFCLNSYIKITKIIHFRLNYLIQDDELLNKMRMSSHNIVLVILKEINWRVYAHLTDSQGYYKLTTSSSYVSG